LARRANALLLLDRGMSCPSIAEGHCHINFGQMA
jgi:hypothetical protein